MLKKILKIFLTIGIVIGVNKNIGFSANESSNYSTITQELPIIDIFPDLEIAKRIASKLRKADVNEIVSQIELNGITDFSAYNVLVQDLTGMEYLNNLSYFSLAGVGNDITNLESLANLTKLQSLAISHINLTDITPLTNLTRLKTLNLGANITDITPLANLTELTYLHLKGNQVSDLTPLVNLTKLETLNLVSNNITDITPLESLTSLQDLHLDDNNISDLTPIAGLTELMYLQLGRNQISDLTPLATLTNLTYLHAGYNQISDLTPLENLVKISSITLDNNQISDLSALANLTKLVFLSVADNEINNITPLTNLSKLIILNLRKNQVTDLSSLESLTYLEHLEAGDNRINDISALSNLTKLMNLDLSNNQISKLPDLEGLIDLGYADISKQKIALPKLPYEQNITIENFVLDNLGTLVDPATISDEGVYVEPNIIWELPVKVPEVNITFNTKFNLPIGYFGDFSGTVYQPFEIDTYTVNFESNGGTVVDAKLDIQSGSTITAPVEPTKVGYTFAGWYKESTLENLWDFEVDTVIGNTTLYAAWELIPVATYTVNFESNGGTVVDAKLDVESGSTITAPAEPTKVGYTFVGWYKESTLENQWDFTTDTVTGDITLYAAWELIPVATYMVNFESNGGTAVNSKLDIESGSTITAPTEPTKVGYTFAGWYKEATLENQWDFEVDTVIGDTTLYAAWELIPVATYIVNFESNGGTLVDAKINIESGSTITAPTKPTKVRYTFAGWYKEATLDNLWDFATDTVIDDTTLYAAWEAIPVATYTVSFESNGGTLVDAKINIESGSTIAVPTEPTKVGYTFAGWHKESTLENLWGFTTDTVTGDITLYAAWKSVPAATYTVSFDSNGGTAVDPILDVLKGSTINPPIAPTKTGYTFVGWYQNTRATQYWNFDEDVVTNDLILFAAWEKNSTIVPGKPTPILPATGELSNEKVIISIGILVLSGVILVMRKKQ